MLSIHIILISIGIIQAIILTIAMLSKNTEANSTHKWLIALCILLTISLIEGVIDISGLDQEYPHLSLLILPINVMFLPLYFAYISDMVGSQRKVSLVVHSAPSLLLFLMVSPILVLDSNTIIQLFNGDMQKTYLVAWIPIILLLLMTITIAQGSYYIPACFKLLSEYRGLICDQLSFNEKVSLRWLKVMTSILALIWCMLVIVLLTGELLSQYLLVAVHITSAILIISLNIFGLQQVQIFRRLRIDIHKITDENVSVLQQEKYQRSSLDQELAEKLWKSTLTFMEKETPFLNNNLSLSSLAELLNMPPHYLSQVINQIAKQNFFDFVNSYRVQFAKELLLETNDTVLKIAMDSGFNSKTTFYKAFKKDSSMSPSEFRQLKKVS